MYCVGAEEDIFLKVSWGERFKNKRKLQDIIDSVGFYDYNAHWEKE